MPERVRQCRSAAPSRRLWAGPFCSSRRPSRSASHESGREGWKRAGRVGWLAAHCAPRRGGVSAACARALAAFWPPCVFCYLLRVIALVLQPPWRGVAVGCVVWFFEVFRTRQQILTRVARVKLGKKGQIRHYGFLLLLIQIPILTICPRLKTHLREPITETSDDWSWVRRQLCAD